VADDHLQIRKSVEHPAHHEPQQMQGGLRVPSPAGGGQVIGHHWIKTAEVRFHHAAWRKRRMQVQRHAEFDRFAQHRRERRIIEEPVPDQTVDHRAAKPVLTDRAIQLRRCGVRVAHRQGRERGEPVGMRGDGRGEVVIRCPRRRHRAVRLQRFGAWHGV